MKKRLFALMMSVLLILTSATVAFAVETADEAAPAADSFQITIPQEDDDPVVYDFKKIAENDRMTLTMDEESTFICVIDKTTGQKWYSNPPVANGSDPYAAGIAITDMRSVVGLTYTNQEKQVKVTNNAVGSVNKDAYEVKMIDGGVHILYDFTEAKIKIPVQYTLTEDGLKAEIPYKEIRENGYEYGTNTINKIEFMKYFGAAGSKDEGYLVIPDGAGAIVKFNNAKNVNEMVYDKEFYGQDMSQITETHQYTSREEKITLPMFGMVKNGYGMLAEVTGGAETASLCAATAGNNLVGDYNIAYTATAYRINYNVPLMSQVASETSNVMYNAEDVTSLDSYTVQYHFDEEKGADYISIANDYRAILLDRGWLTDDEVTDRLYTEFYGAVNKTKSFAGIIYTARETLTSFEEAKAILADLKDGGVKNVTALYQNFSDDYFDGKIEIKLAASGSLGGQSALNDLINEAGENGTPVSVAADFVTIPNGGNDFSTYWDVADAINVSPIEVFPYSLNGNTMDLSQRPYYLVDPQKYGKGVDTLLNAVESKGYKSLYFDEEALQLYSDLAPEGFQSERASGAQAEQFARLAESGAELTLSNPNAFLMAYADYIVDIPVCSSKEILFDGDVPFLQTVLRGLKSFGGESMNINDASQTSFLRHLEYGTDMKYSLINAESEALLNTKLTFLYSATYDRSQYLSEAELESDNIETYANQIKARYAAFEELGEKVGQAGISAHTRNGDVAVTTYDNGVKVIVNYGSEAATVDGTTVEALGFAIV
ncbi:MAG: hypothetical protein IJD01_08695 [Clostridia bacterium]|nr:hypothetical protein [Clostridia bacterium]